MSQNGTNNVKSESETECPPGMKFDPESGKCMAINGERINNEEDNAGSSADKGASMPQDADNTANPPATHDCPPGTSWNSDTGSCEPSGDSAGQPGGGGTGSPEAPGKEFYKLFENLMAQHSQYNATILEQFKNSQQKQLESLTELAGIRSGVKSESASFGGYRTSKVSKGHDPKALFESTVANPAKWFERVKKGMEGNEGYISWNVSVENYIKNLKKQWVNYGQNQAGVPVKSEGFTITGGDMPQVFSKQVYLIPGGRMRVPIRQFLDTQIIEDSDRYNWYKVSGFDFDDTTAEGSEPGTEEAQTVTKVTATPALTRANITVKYSDIENAPFDLIEAFNRAAGLGALDAEAKEILDTTYNADLSNTNWVRGDTGADLSGAPGTDDVVGLAGMKQEGIYAGKRSSENQGGDTTPGSLVAFLHPKAVEELVLDTANDFFTGQNALHSTALGVLENRLGVDIVVSNRVNATSGAVNSDAYRNILMMKGVIGLAVASDLQIEAQRRPDLSAVKVGARHRIKGATIDETMTARISSLL
jgi:hypothetical protein